MPKGQTNELYAHGYNILIVCIRKMINVQERERENEYKKDIYMHMSRGNFFSFFNLLTLPTFRVKTDPVGCI